MNSNLTTSLDDIIKNNRGRFNTPGDNNSGFRRRGNKYNNNSNNRNVRNNRGGYSRGGRGGNNFNEGQELSYGRSRQDRPRRFNGIQNNQINRPRSQGYSNGNGNRMRRPRIYRENNNYGYGMKVCYFSFL